MSHKKECPSKEELIERYNKPGCTISILAREYGTSNPTVRKWLIGYNIERKDQKTASIEANNRGDKALRESVIFAHEKLSDKEWLYDQRVNMRKSIKLIGEEIGCSHVLVRKYIRKYSIPSFDLKESETSIKNKLDNKKYLEEHYQDKNMDEIAELIGTSKSAISLAFKKLGIVAKPANSYDRKFNRISKGQQEVIDYIMSITNDEILVNNRTSVGIELDIYIPSKKFAIEYNGLFYHAENENEEKESLHKGRMYHINKTNICKNNDIFLFHLFSDLWEDKQEIVKSMISNKIGANTIKYYARELIIKMVDCKSANLFFEENHLQGSSQANINYGLFKNEELVSVMSFDVSRFNSNYDYELIRFANKKFVNVIGGFSRLLSKFRKEFPKSTIISYSDTSYSYGNVYKSNGFEFLHENLPNYSYLDKSYRRRFPRTMFTKKQIKTKFNIINDNFTEKEMMKILGFRRIWNCGTVAWIIK